MRKRRRGIHDTLGAPHGRRSCLPRNGEKKYILRKKALAAEIEAEVTTQGTPSAVSPPSVTLHLSPRHRETRDSSDAAGHELPAGSEKTH